MVIDDGFDTTTRLRSEGKLLEIIPILENPSGQPLMLPPVVYPIANELLGYKDWHVIGYPIVYQFHDRWYIPGSASSVSTRLSFIVSIMEGSPSNEPIKSTVDMNAVLAIIEAIGKENE